MAAPRVLITGASGFVGRHTLAPLRRLGFDIIAPTRAECDLLDPGATHRLLAETRPSHVLHCAWYVTHGKFWTAPENLDWVAATLLLAREAAWRGTTRFVAVGTSAEYDWSDDGRTPRRETDPTHPATLYGRAKLATFELLADFLPAEHVSFAWARLFHLWGEGEHPARLAPSILTPIAAGQHALVRHGQLIRDLMPVARAGVALARLLASDLTGPVNIASGRATSLADFARVLAGDRTDLLDLREEPAPGQPLRMMANISRLRTIQ